MRAICLFLVFALSLPATALAYPAKVEKVLDGDTLEISIPGSFDVFGLLRASHKKQLRVRLYGIDCPERGQPFGPEAAASIRRIEGQTVEVTPMSTDRYGRTVALIQLERGELLQESLIREGAAWVYAQFCTIPQCRSWKRLEDAARQRQRGLWRERAPLEPWAWRRKHENK